jgi:Mce-associated membrane protein
VSDSNGPVRRRRIAGEAPAATPAKKVAKKPVAKKPVAPRAGRSADVPAPAAEKTPSTKKTPSAKKTPSTKKTPTATKTPTAKKATSAAAPAAKAEPVARDTSAPESSETSTSTSARTGTPTTRRPTVARPVAPKVPTRSTSSTERASDVDRPASRPARRDLAWLVPAALLALASLAVGVFLVINPPGAEGDIEATDRQASSAAASAAETIFSYRYDELDQHLKESKALMTPTFAKEFDKIAPALTELAPQRKIVVEAAAREAAALPCGDDCSSSKAEVLVFVDQARLVGDATQPTVFANRIKVSMVKDDDGWRVANIRAL